MINDMTAGAFEVKRSLMMEIGTCGPSYRAACCAADAGKRFVRSAGLLPEGGFLGVRFSADRDGRYQLAAFSGGNAPATKEDFEWIFRDCATAGSERPVRSGALCPQNGKTYALRCAAPEEDAVPGPEYGFDDEYQREQRARFGRCREVLAELARLGGAIRFLVPSGSGGRGAVLIRLANEMTLRMKTMLFQTFSCAAAVEIRDGDPVGLLPADCLQDGLAILLEVLITPSAGETDGHELEDDDADDDDIADDEDAGGTEPPPAQTIEELDLSARAFNALRRAGIRDLAQLRAMTDEELRRVRNIGKRSFSEIREKLMRAGPAGRGARQAEQAGPGCAELLDGLIGLRSVKEQVRRIVAYARMKKDLERQGKNLAPVVLNMEFSGNPGTAKTTVARIVAGLFHEIGLLSSGEVIEVGRADLVAQYEGHTAEKVRALFEKARGKLLFIDEAYSLVEAWNGAFGDEAINTIVQEMENRRGETVVVFAGYPDRMAEFLARNPGLGSRVPFHIAFPDYSAQELVRIAELEAARRGFTIRPDAGGKVAALCELAARRPELGNGRYCRNLVEDAILGYALRVYGNGGGDPDADFALSAEDFGEPGAAAGTEKARPIGFSVN